MNSLKEKLGKQSHSQYPHKTLLRNKGGLTMKTVRHRKKFKTTLGNSQISLSWIGKIIESDIQIQYNPIIIPM
jgi:hypothetical protein